MDGIGSGALGAGLAIGVALDIVAETLFAGMERAVRWLLCMGERR